jgi:hypothetical protein
MLVVPGFLALAVPPAEASLDTSPLELMIAPDSFVAELLPLKALRESQGVHVDIVTTTYLQSLIGGFDLPQSIKAYVDQRAATDSSLRYVLLAADDPTIPGRILQVANRTAFPTMSIPERAMVSDYYYAVPGTDFINASDLGDEYTTEGPWYGISDSSWSLTPSIHVGRIPVSTVPALRDYVARLVGSEQSPPAGAWASRAVLGFAVASVPDLSFASRRLGDDAGVTFAAAESAIAAAGLTNISLRDYPNYPAAYDPALDRLDGPTFLGEWGFGASLVVLAARDSPASGGPGDAYAGDGSSSVFVPPAPPSGFPPLANGAKLPVFVAAYGGSANFSLDNGSNIESALTAAGGGASLAVGFTGHTASGTQAGGVLGGWTLAADVTEELLQRPGPIGDVLDAARARFVANARLALGGAFDENNASLRRAVAGLTLLGDPASRPFVGPLKQLDIAFSPGVPPNASVTLDVAVSAQGVPVANATVAVLDETGELRATGVSDLAATARLTFTSAARAAWTVHATAAGYRQASGPLAIDAPPHVALITPAEGSSVAGRLNFTGLAGDPDQGDTVTAVEVALNGFNWTPALGTNAWSFEVDTDMLTNGPNTFAARASDGTVWSAPQTVRFNVTNPKPPLQISPYADVVLNEDEVRAVVLDLASHFRPSGPGASLNASASTDDPLRLTLGGGSLAIQPALNYNGLAHIAMRVSDSYGGITLVNLTVRIAAVNDPPVLTVGTNFTVEEGGTVNFDPRASDPDGSAPFLYVESGPTNATVTGWQTPRGSAGDYTIVIAATDGQYIARALVLVTVTSHNSPPAGELVAPASGEAGREVDLSAEHVTDRDNDSVTVDWDFGDGQNGGGAHTSHVYAAPGTYTVTLTLSDGRNSTVLTKAISIDPYRPPAGPPSSLTSFLGYASLAVIAVCAALATYLLFVSPRSARRAPLAGSRSADEGEE